MATRSHPHADAIYRVIPGADGTFSVEVVIPESYPTKVSPFSTEADAEAWIAEHRRRVQSEERAGPMVSLRRHLGVNARGQGPASLGVVPGERSPLRSAVTFLWQFTPSASVNGD